MKKEVHPVIVAVAILLLLITLQVVYWRNLAPEKGKPPPGGSPKAPGGAEGGAAPPSGLAEFQVATIAGATTPGYQDGPAAQARFDGPAALARGADGTLYVADSRNHAIRKLSPNGVVSTVAGAPGQGAFGGFADGPAKQARFSAPAGLAVLPDGSLLVADTGNHRVRRIAPDGTVSTFAGGDTPRNELGRPSGGYRDGAAAQAQFRFPAGLAVDGAGVAYVADAGNKCVRRIANGVVSTVPASGGKMESPTALLLDATGLRVSDSGGHTLWAGPAAGPLHPWKPKQASLATPAGLAVARGQLFVADAGAHGLYRVGADGSQLVVGQAGAASWADGNGSAARLMIPAGMVADPDGTLTIADFGNNCLRRVVVP